MTTKTRIPLPIASLDLVAELRGLRASPMPHKYLSKVLLHEPDLRIVLVALRDGAEIPPHHASSTLVLQVFDGHVVARVRGERLSLSAGQVLVIAPRVEHAILADEDAALVLTLAAPGPRVTSLPA